MIMPGLFKRIKKGLGFNAFSRSSWNRVCDILENIEGVGCSIIKDETGKNWKVVVDGYQSDIPFPEGVTPAWFDDSGDPDDPPLPPCGHDGNTGGGGTAENHPGNEDSGGGEGDEGEGSEYDHPGDSEGEDGVTPESGGDCNE